MDNPWVEKILWSRKWQRTLVFLPLLQGIPLFFVKVTVLVSQLCPTLCNPWTVARSGSSVHGILQARILEWATISFSNGSFFSKISIIPQILPFIKFFLLRNLVQFFFQTHGIFISSKCLSRLIQPESVISTICSLSTCPNTEYSRPIYFGYAQGRFKQVLTTGHNN